MASPKKKKPAAAAKKKKSPAKGKSASKSSKSKAVAKKGAKRTAPPKRAAPKKKPARKAVKPAVSSAPPKLNEKAHQLAKLMAGAVIDKKALDVVILDVRGKASYADYIVLASGESQPQVRAMAEGIEARLKLDGNRPLSREGEEAGSWLLLDYGEVVAHLFDQDARGFYDLEGLWADAPRERVG